MNRHLYRSRDDRMLAGVAGGLADLWDADPSLVRIIWAVLVFFTGGVALVVYIVMAIVVPEEDALNTGFGATTTPADSASSTDTPPSSASAPDSRAASREARREARAARRAAGGRGSGGILIGALLVLAGAYFLIRDYIPQFDVNWLWPTALIVLGVVVLASAFRRPDVPR